MTIETELYRRVRGGWRSLVKCDVCKVEFEIQRAKALGQKQHTCSIHRRKLPSHLRKNYTGLRFGKLVAIEPTDQSAWNSIVWRFRCDCGNIVERPAYNVAGTARKGSIPQCRQCRGLAPGQAGRNTVVAQYRKQYPEMENLTDEEFDILLTGNCYLCGAPPSNVTRRKRRNGGFTYNSIDAIDPKLGHVKGNLASCCRECNIHKWDSTLGELFAWIGRITAYYNPEEWSK